MSNSSKIPKIAILVLLVLILQATYAKANNLGYERLTQDWHEHNFQLKDIELSLADAQRAFDQTKRDVANAGSSWSYLVDMFKSMDVEISPSMKFGTVMRRGVRLEKAKRLFSQQQLSAKTRQDGEYIKLREYYLDYWRLNTKVQIDEKRLEVAAIIRDKHNLLFKQDKLGELDLTESKINYLEVEQQMIESQQLLKEKQLMLNAYIGVELDTCYQAGIWEEQKDLTDSVDNYVANAVNERLEIKLISDQIANNQLTIETYEKYFNYNSMTEHQQNSYDDLRENNKTLGFHLTKKKTEVEKQLRELFLDISYEKFKVKILLNIRNDTNSNFLKVKELYDQGRASEIDLLQAEIEYMEAHDDYLRSIYSYNTQIYSFNSLSGAGLNVGLSSVNNPQGGGH